jgi:glutathione S-transferase
MNKFMRPEEFVYEPAVEFQLDKVRRGLADINGKIEEFDSTLTIGPLSVACAIGYTDFRFPDLGWRDDNPKLATWYTGFCELPSMKATHFEMPS